MNKYFFFFIIFILLVIVITILAIFIDYLKFNKTIYLENSKLKNLPNIKTVADKLKSGDLLFTLYEHENISKKNAYYKRLKHNFYFKPNIHHIGIIYKKNNIKYVVECIAENDHCTIGGSELNPDFVSGVRMVKFDDYLEFFNKKKKDNCPNLFGVRFLNKKIDNDKLFYEIEGMKNIQFDNLNNVYLIAYIGLLVQKLPKKIKTGISNMIPTRSDRDGIFCSEFIAIILQRMNLLDKKYNARLFYPFNFNELYDEENYGDNPPYSKTYYFE